VKIFDDMFIHSRVGLVNWCVGQTDRQTDGQTNRISTTISYVTIAYNESCCKTNDTDTAAQISNSISCSSFHIHESCLMARRTARLRISVSAHHQVTGNCRRVFEAWELGLGGETDRRPSVCANYRRCRLVIYE